MKYCIVKRPITFKTFIPFISVFLLTVVLAVSAMTSFTFIPILIAILGAVALVYILRTSLNCEYEYTIEGETFIVALIRNNTSRKELFTGNMSHILSCTPFEDRDKYASPRTHINASSDANILYYALFSDEEITKAVTFSPSEEFLKEMRLLAPSKVKVNIMK